MKKRLVLLLFLGLIIALMLINVKKQRRSEEQEISVMETSDMHENIETLETEDEILEDMEDMILGDEGDEGNEMEEYTIQDSLSVPPERATKDGFRAFLLEYSNTQNYTRDGFNFGYAGRPYEEGISENDSAARITGMGNVGYLVWVLRNTFGICDEDYQTPYLVYQKSEKVDLADLQIGDIGFVYNEDRPDNFAGICVGFEGENPIFSFMDGSRSKKFPFGSNRLCFVKADRDEYIEESMPVGLSFFCRPDLPWTYEQN